MNINTVLGVTSAAAFALPILIIIFSRLFINVSLFALVVYFFSAFFCNLLSENIIVLSPSLETSLAVISNYLDVPLILLSVRMFSTEKWMDKAISIGLAAFLGYELIIFFNYRLLPVSTKYVMGPGIVLIVVISLYLFINNIKRTIMQGKGIGKTLIITSILFAYGSYLLVYIFFYIQKTSNKADVFTIYYLSSIIFSLLMASGLFWVRKRFNEIKEVHTTRKELGVFFDHSITPRNRFLQ
ncbi:MAG TPA: hypothetical protein VM935_10785 [Chitinophagaceae bacterium]|jgi:hypothetical protein|nr:hypothetical protein [Chitinophagaceae bacterium]